MPVIPSTEANPETDVLGTPACATYSAPRRFKTDIDIILARDELPNANDAMDLATSTSVTNEQPLVPKAVRPDSKGQADRRNNKRGAGSRSHKPDHKRKSDWKEADRSNAKTAKISEPHAPTSFKDKRLPKRKVAVLLGYYGKGYKGSQVNPGVRTIEGDVFDAFVKAGCISEENSAHPNKVGLQRAARTDANVHAACNLISLKLILDPPSLDELKPSNSESPSDSTNFTQHHSLPLIQHINSFLPEEIRLWSLVRVQNSFHARTLCDSRTYEYSLPTYLFLPPKPGTALYERLNSNGTNVDGKIWSECFEPDETEGSWWKGEVNPDLGPPPVPGLDGTSPHLSEFKMSTRYKKSSYRISQPMLQRIKQSVEKYKGTHNFHNFTVGKEFKERNSIRIIREMSVSDPFIVGSQEGQAGTEWISVKFYGQSFMLHQIRKMIGLIILLCRTRTPSTLIPELYGPVKVGIPKAPGLGLILQNPHFDGYNKRVMEANRITHKQKLKKNTASAANEDPDLTRETIEPAAWTDIMDRFKKEVLYKKMWEEEQKDDAFGVWINYVDVCNDSDLDFLNPKGVLPPSITDASACVTATRPGGGTEKQLNSDEEDIKYQDGEEIEEG